MASEACVMAYDLTTLGWKAFQDLASAVAAEVLQRPVQTFLGSRDGGRDGAFLGTWTGGAGSLKSTIQVKYIGGAGARLTLSKLKDELEKVEMLAADGLAEDYVVITNAGVTGVSEAAICKAFEAKGVKTCRVYHGDWIVEQIKASAQLRKLVPRVYGIGDLSHIVTGHAQEQAKAILAEMGDDLACFVPTDSYRAAVKALDEYRFLILLGDPASGKSTIAALLALGSLDEGCSGAVRIGSPEQLHLWHPTEKQVLWVDDAFGANQFDTARINRWNTEFPQLRAAIANGARVIFTSRNYIWSAARPLLRTRDFPLLSESQVVIDVHNLTANERAQILYNHVRRKQPRSTRIRLKPHLASVAESPRFLPETARRLGDPFFTSKIPITRTRLVQLVEHPVEFLIEILEGLDGASRAAIALIFLHPEGGVPSPIAGSKALDIVVRLTGTSPADISAALVILDDSLTRRVSDEDGLRWMFRHPTITDAFATIVGQSPELVELYVGGARVERLVREVVCAPKEIAGAHIRVPTILYPTVRRRLADLEIDEALRSFLGERCDDTFLRSFVEERPEVLEWVMTVTTSSLSLGGETLVAALHSAGLLPEERRQLFVERLTVNAIDFADAAIFENRRLCLLFTAEELALLESSFEQEWLYDLSETFGMFRSRFSSSDEHGLYTEFKENIERAERRFGGLDRAGQFEALIEQIEDHLNSLPYEEDYQANPDPSSRHSGNISASSPIDVFLDIDEE